MRHEKLNVGDPKGPAIDIREVLVRARAKKFVAFVKANRMQKFRIPEEDVEKFSVEELEVYMEMLRVLGLCCDDRGFWERM